MNEWKTPQSEEKHRLLGIEQKGIKLLITGQTGQIAAQGVCPEQRALTLVS